MSKPVPTGLTVHNMSKVLDVEFDDGKSFSIPFELLRVYSPSAEVKGHGEGQEVLQVGNREVGIAALDPVGRREFLRELIDGVIERGTTVVFSTHILSDLERVALDVAFLQGGKIVLQGALDELLEGKNLSLEDLFVEVTK